MLINTIS